MRFTVTVLANQQVTLVSGQTRVLTQSRHKACKVTLTGIAGEFTTIPFQTIRFGRFTSEFFEASSVKLSFFDTLPSGRILATTPDGVASLDIVFELRTGIDA
jgi:hypothetical protein